jgi:hypothetical protein
MLLFFNKCLFPISWILTLGMLLYKGLINLTTGLVFPFVPQAYVLEVFAVFPWAIIEATRVFLGYLIN